MSSNTSQNQKQNIIDFIDRDSYKTLIHNAYREIIESPTEYKIIFLYGAGGFGKTSLLNNCIKEMNDPGAKPVHVSLEITSKDDKLDILIKFRKSLPKNHYYPLFDYAIQYLWNSLNTSKMDDEFLSITKSALYEFLKSGTDVAVTAVVPIEIAAASVMDLLNLVYNRIKHLYGKHSIYYVISDIKNMQPHDLIDLLPELLGLDIHRAFLKGTLVFVIDAFQQYSNHMADMSNWMTTLVQNIGYGLFIITSREKISWPSKIQKYVIPKELDILPQDEVRCELKKRLCKYPQLVENILTVTGCIPIFLDLAVKALFSQDSEKPSFDHFYFESKEDIINKFLIHLPEDEQEIITTLAIVQIFNQEIFEFLIKDLHLSISVLRFADICQRSLIRNVEFDNCLYKTHDVISENISHITNKITVQRILSSYMTIIKKQAANKLANTQISMLLKHIISLVIINELCLSKEDTENLLDIYFVVKESLLPFDCDDIPGFASYQPLISVYYFIKVLSNEREDSTIRLTWLNNIQDHTAVFGKHIKSYELIKGYLRALCESGHWLKTIVNGINSVLTTSEEQEWYYGQTKIFFGDCNVSYGNFKTGIRELQIYEQLLPKLSRKANDAFQITRHIAHGYRFNMFLEEAEKLYRGLIEGEGVIPTPLQKVYIFTNICETCCYFKPDEVLKVKKDALDLAKKFKDLKSQGKIYYSLAIVYILKRDYKRSKWYINKSIDCNQQDGYLSGQLYAYMVRAYYEYARQGTISSKTYKKILDIQKNIQVYEFFSLPLAMMQGKYSDLRQIRNDYEWLDFDRTALVYRKFLDSIHVPES